MEVLTDVAEWEAMGDLYFGLGRRENLSVTRWRAGTRGRQTRKEDREKEWRAPGGIGYTLLTI